MLLTNFRGWILQAHLLLLQTAFQKKSDDLVHNLGLNHHFNDSLGNLIFEFVLVALCLFNKKPVLHTNTPATCSSSSHGAGRIPGLFSKQLLPSVYS